MSSDSLPEVAIGVLLHLRHHQLLVEGAAVDADAHRLAVVDRDLADGGELLVAPLAGADVAGIDAVLVERRRAVGKARQQEVTVVVEVADQRRGAAGIEHALLDLGHRRGRFGKVHGDAHHLRPRLPQLDALLRGPLRIRRVGHRHRLHDDRRAAAHACTVADLANTLHQSSSLFKPPTPDLVGTEHREIHRVVVLDPVGKKCERKRRTTRQDDRMNAITVRPSGAIQPPQHRG